MVLNIGKVKELEQLSVLGFYQTGLVAISDWTGWFGFLKTIVCIWQVCHLCICPMVKSVWTLSTEDNLN